MLVKHCFSLTLFILASNSWAVNKCTTPEGKVVFQDRPCAGQGETLVVRPASGAAAPTPSTTNTPGSAAGSPSSQAGAPPKSTKYEDQLARAQDERERRDKWFAMRNAGQALDRQMAQCAQEQQRLSKEKAYSRNNLAGATRDVSISNEMQAAAALCSERVKIAQTQLESAKATCERIKCIPAAQ